MKRTLTQLTASLPLLLSGCASLEPEIPIANPNVAWQWQNEAGARLTGVDLTSHEVRPGTIRWKARFTDPHLRQLIQRALEGNRDLRTAILTVREARARYRIEDSHQTPSVNATGSMTRESSGGGVSERWGAGIGIADYEIDLFDRRGTLSDAAWDRYMAEDFTRQAVELALIGEVANSYLTLLANRKLKSLAERTLKNREASFALSLRRHALGDVSALDIAQERTTVEAARKDVARFEGRVAQARHALARLTGSPLAPGDIPEELTVDSLASRTVPGGLPSEVLLSRPDVRAAEYRLRGANANIGVARAAFFPAITLTASTGTASDELSGLFGAHTGTWAFMPQVHLPIFQGGRLKAQLESARLARDKALAEYEKAIQTGFSEVADSLAFHQSLQGEMNAQRHMLSAARESHRLSRIRYESGLDSYLALLEAERTLYAAQKESITLTLEQQQNLINLYKALGGAWQASL